MRDYTNEVPSYAALFTLEQWIESLESGSIISDDGQGYWVKNGLESEDEVFTDNRTLDATHVAWYNK